MTAAAGAAAESAAAGAAGFAVRRHGRFAEDGHGRLGPAARGEDPALR